MKNNNFRIIMIRKYVKKRKERKYVYISFASKCRKVINKKYAL